MPDVERTDDGRHIVVNGRRWRASDPSIPDGLRQQLVDELMSARRAVKAARGSDTDLAAARHRVQDAKVALGERGAPWWDVPSAQELATRIESTLRTLARSRDFPKTICPSEVARTIGADHWRDLMPVVRSVALELIDDGQLELTQGGKVVDDPAGATGAIRYRIPAPDPT